MTLKLRFFRITYFLPDSKFFKVLTFRQMHEYLSRKTKGRLKTKSFSSNTDFLNFPVSGRVIA